MRVGISVLTHAGQSVWENGIGQSVFFLAQLLRQLPTVEEVVLLDCGDQACLPADAGTAGGGLSLLRPREASDRVDVVIEMAGGVEVAWLDYMRARGKKVVYFCCGQPYVNLIEPSVFNRTGYAARADRCDEVWVFPKDRVYIPMLRGLHRCPVYEVPFLWDPVFVEARAAVVRQAGCHFGYVPPLASAARGLRVAIFEPNVSVVKSSVLPMLICDRAYRVEPETITHMHVLNSVQMSGQMSFDFLTRSLDLYQVGRVSLEGRHDFVGYMSQFANAVVSHQWQNDQNILYLDALYGGYPLIHNSPWLSGLGYYYPESDITEGANQLREAARSHDSRLDEYRQAGRKFLTTLSPRAASNAQAYAERLDELIALPWPTVVTC
ncbi:hypothetical protein WI87_13995 [Burkholderia ubonensis]|uniref:DUF2827 domain-containing protein n=1 Tax=Burkholderia ubonensis TaxID=101571 RepID=UPI0007559B3D|nr:DUF2827 domain-containing protein [Burkholderia ubonensis]KVD59173.1 hypothetical protein WI87_13995 [Burkholderia ubonensis]